MVRDLLRRWRRRFLRGAGTRERELAEEMRLHVELETESLVRRGHPPDEARRLARRAFGNVLATQDAARATAPFHRLEALAQDLRLAPRLLWRSPGLAAAIVLSLALGIGVTAGVFTLLDGLLFRARVSYDPGGFVQLAAAYRDSLTRGTFPGAVPLEDFRAYRAGARSLRGVAAWSPAHLTLGRVDPWPTLGLLVSCEFFPLYGAERPLLGRLFAREECETPGGGGVVVLGEGLWRDRLAADSGIVGRAITLDGAPFTVVGVMPASYAGRLRGPGIWLPYSAQPRFFGGADHFRDGAPAWLTVVGRLAPGWTRSRAAAEIGVFARRLDAQHPGRVTEMRLTNGSVIAEPSAGWAAAWLVPVLMIALTLPLVLVCANVTTLLLARATARRRELAVRLALGAGLRRLVRMMLAESAALAAVAGLVAVPLLYLVPSVVRGLLFSADTPFYDTAPRGAALAYLAAVTLGSGLLAGWVPTAEARRQRLTAALKDEPTALAAARGRWGTRDALISVQVAVGTVLVAGAVLFARAERAMATEERGYEIAHTLVLPLGPVGAPRTAGAGEAAAQVARLAGRVRALPSVRGVAFASVLGGGDDESGDVVRVGLPGTRVGATRLAARSVVSPEFFGVMGIPVLRGRAFGGTAAAPEDRSGAVVSASLARALWPGTDPLGQPLDDGSGRTLTVVGVVPDVQPLAGGRARLGQLYTARDRASAGGLLVVRFTGDGAAVTRAVNDAAVHLDPDAVPTARTVASIVARQAELFSRYVTLVGALGALAIVLAAVGIYGVVAFAVAQRRKEFGIRMALGASPARLAGAVANACARPLLAGLLAGLALAVGGALALSRGFRGTPVEFDVASPASYLAAVAVVAAAAGVAVCGPLLRAARMDPVSALRRD
jgi:predicted permease